MRVDTTSFFAYNADTVASDEVEVLASCSTADWACLMQAGSRRRFRANDVVAAEGSDDRALFFVLEGRLQTVIGEGRKRRMLSPIPTGSVFGELSFLDGAPRSATVIAETDVEVLRLAFADFETLARSRPALAHQLLLDLSRLLVMRVRRLTAAFR